MTVWQDYNNVEVFDSLDHFATITKVIFYVILADQNIIKILYLIQELINCALRAIYCNSNLLVFVAIWVRNRFFDFCIVNVFLTNFWAMF